MYPTLPDGFNDSLKPMLEAIKPGFSETIYGNANDKALKEGLEELTNCGLFENISSLYIPWQQKYHSQEFVKLLSTYSNFQALTPSERSAMLKAIEELVDNEYSAVITLDYLAALHMGNKR